MFRLLGLLGGLALATDLGTGAPLEESLKRCVVATRLARAMGCADAETADVVYTSLLQHLGCSAYSHEGAAVWGDDVAFVRLAFLTDFADQRDVWRTFAGGIAASNGWSRARVMATALTKGRRGETEGPAATCEIARDASRWLGLPESVQLSLAQALTTWDGKGHPTTSGEEIPLPTRVMHVASTAVMFALHAGPEEAVAQVRKRAGTGLDPTVAEAFDDHAAELLTGLDEIDAYDEALASEPDPVRLVAPDQLEAVARTFGHLADLKSPWLQGHSAGVADLAATAVHHLGLTDSEATVRVAGHLHDLGRLAVSSRIWDKPGPLSASEREQAQLHAYHSERVVARVPALAEVAVLVGQHHERSDGTGYHRGVTATQLSMPSRVLATADAFRNLVEDRPYRPGFSHEEVGTRLRTEVRTGRLDGDAVAAVLASAGLGSGVRRPRPADLTARQVEVLRLVARGLSNRQVADRLVISTRTAEHHVQDVYTKIGVSTRARARRSTRCSTAWWAKMGSPTQDADGYPDDADAMTTATDSPAARAGTRPAPLLTPAFLMLAVADLAYFTAAGVAIFALPLYVTGPLGSDEAGAGLAFGAFAVTALVLRPFAGRASDTRGRRPLLLGGAVIAAVAMALTAHADGLLMVVALRLTLGVAEAMFFVASFAALADLAPPSRMGEALSYNSLGLYLGLALGPLLGDLLVHGLGFTAAWYGAAFLLLLAAVVVLRLGETYTPRAVTDPPAKLIHRKAIPASLGFMTSVVAMGGFLAFATLHAGDVGLTRTSIPIAMYGGVVVVCRVMFAKVPDRLPALPLGAAALAVIAGGLLLMAAWASPAGILLGAVLMALGITFSTPAFFSAVFATATPAERGAAAGTASASLDLGLGGGPILLGFIASGAGIPWAFAAGAGVALAGSAWTLLLAGGLARRSLPAGTDAPDARG